MIELKCGCQITDEGKFLVSEVCAGCTECNIVSGFQKCFHAYDSGNISEYNVYEAIRK